MQDLDFDLRSHVSRRSLVAAGLFLIAVAAVATSTHRFGAAVNGLEKARPVWLWAAAAAFLGSLLVSASAWRGAFGLCGAELTRLDASARYGLGSLVNSLTPVRAGGAVRFALFGSCEGRPKLNWHRET